MARHPIPLKRGVIFMHRWLGNVLCLIFLMWFASVIEREPDGGEPSLSY
jgi:hypothetical protein